MSVDPADLALPPAAAFSSPEAAPQRVQFAILLQAEKASFETGLLTRIRARLVEAVKAPTAAEYGRARDRHLLAYLHLSGILRVESSHGAEPVTDAQVLVALQQVERWLGESWRHKLEHAINTSQVAARIVARLGDRLELAQIDPKWAGWWLNRWMGGWIRLNWAADCVFVAADGSSVVQPEVVAAVFDDLHQAATGVYAAACELHDAHFGDPDDE